MIDLNRFGIEKETGKFDKEIVYGLALVYNAVNQQIGEYLKQYDLSVGKLNILIAIQRHGKKEGLKQVEVSQYLIVTPSNMTKMIDKLQKEGLVIREAMPGDRRVNILKITPKGEHLLASMWNGYIAKLNDVVAGLTKEKQKVLAGLLADWLEVL